MKTAQIKSLIGLATGLLLVTGLAADEPSQTTFTGGFSIGVRSVDVDGADRKFKEDFNLEDGPRLFDFHFNLVPQGSNRKFADQVRLEVTNLGGDPFEAINFGVRKYGKYNLTYNRTKSDYFYYDMLLPPALFNPTKSNAGDFHTFDFERVRDRAKLDINLSQAAQLTFGMDRFTKRGESTTTLDVSRDEFELDRPIHESMNSYYGAFRYAWDKATLVLEERVRDYDNAYDIFLPGRSLGEDPEDATILDFFFLDQPYDLSSNTHVVRLLADPNDKLNIRVSGLIQSLDMDAGASLESQGFDFRGLPFSESLTGGGSVDRDADRFEIELTYLATHRVALVAGARQQSVDQDGTFAWAGNLGSGDWQIDTTGFSAGVEFYASPQLTLHVGLAQESRDVDAEWSLGSDGKTEDEKTDRTGFYAGAAWRPSKAFQLTVDLEENSFDDPFTLATPTDRSRYRVRGRYRFGDGWTASGSLTMKDYENNDSGWVSDTDITAVRLGRSDDRFSFSVGYSAVDAERSVSQAVEAGFLTNVFDIRYLADSSFFDARGRVKANDRLTLGAEVRMYENDGSFGLERDDFRGYIEVGVFDDYVLQLGYRTVDYDEVRFDFDDYDADMVDIGVGYSW